MTLARVGHDVNLHVLTYSPQGVASKWAELQGFVRVPVTPQINYNEEGDVSVSLYFTTHFLRNVPEIKHSFDTK